MATAITAAILGSAVATTSIEFVAVDLLVSVGLSVVTSYALAALGVGANKRSVSALSSGVQTNVKNPTAPHQVIYGQVRTGGIVTYLESTQNTKYLHQIITLSGHEVDSIGDIYINDKIATLDSNGFVTTDSGGNNWQSKIRIKKHTGAPGQVADPDLLAETENTKLNSNFVGNGIAYLYVRMEYDQSVFSNGIPLFTAVVKGKKVYDPRASTTAWSDNAALCLRDYLASDYGMSATSSEFDDTFIDASADVCDQLVTLSTGGTEKRYSLSGVFNTDSTPLSILTDMSSAAGGTLFYGQGQYKYKVGYYTNPVKDFTLTDLRSNISIDTRVARRDNYNSVKGTFNDASQAYITVDYPAITSSTFTAQDGGIQSSLDLKLPFTTSGATAQRLAKQTLYRQREQISVSADFGLSAFEVEVGDNISLTLDRYGWSSKVFEVHGWNFYYDKNMELKATLTLRETSSAAFSWAAEESQIIGYQTTLPNGFYVPSVGFNLTTSTRILHEKIVGVLNVNITSSDNYAYLYEAQYKKSTDSVWETAGTSSNISFEILDVDSVQYDVRVRSINYLGVTSDWTYINNYPVSISSITPSDITDFYANISGGNLHLNWAPIPDQSLSYYKVRVAKEETGASWQNAIDAVNKVPRPASSVSIPVKPGTYMMKSYSKTGNPSTNYASFVIPAASLTTYSTKLTQTENPTFGGVKTGVSVDSGSALVITDTTTTIPSGGTYDFTTYIDTGAVRRFHSYIDVTVYRKDISAGLFDNIAGTWDSLPGLFDDLTGSGSFADTNVSTYISTTLDDPSATPTWSSWQVFQSGDFYGRAAKFKVVLSSQSSDITPAITALQAIVEY